MRRVIAAIRLLNCERIATTEHDIATCFAKMVDFCAIGFDDFATFALEIFHDEYVFIVADVIETTDLVDIVFGDFAAFTTQIDATFALIDETRIAVAFRAVIVATCAGESYDS